MSRRDDLAEGLARTRARIEAACRDVERDPSEVTLVVVTKFYPASDVAILRELGVGDIGENRDQEAAAKIAELGGPDAVAASGLTVHFLGQVQSKKCGSVASYADVVESVSREKIVAGLGRAATARGRELDALVQVSLDGDPARGGAPVADVERLADLVASTPGLQLRGLMAVVPLGADPDAAFTDLAALAARVRASHPQAASLSAGMSGDLESAIRHGATHVRVGTAILGTRQSHQYRRRRTVLTGAGQDEHRHQIDQEL